MELPQVITIFNIIAVIVVIYFTNRMVSASSTYNWNPGDSTIQDREKIKILQCIVAIAFVGLVAAIVNVFLG